MLYFLYGANTFLLKEKLKQIIAKYKKVHSDVLELERFNLQETDLKEVFDRLKQISLFIKKKLFVLENVLSKPEVIKSLDAMADSSHIIVLIQGSQIKETDKLFKALLEKAKSQEFKEPTSQQIAQWLKKRFAFYKASINGLALLKLQNSFGFDMWALEGAVKTLSACSRNITEKEIDQFCKKPSLQADIFKTIEAIAKKNKQKALTFLEALLEQGESPFYVLTMFAWQIKNIALAKENQLKGKPFFVKKTKMLANSFSDDCLKKIYQQIMLTDLSIKTGRALPTPALQSLILSV